MKSLDDCVGAKRDGLQNCGRSQAAITSGLVTSESFLRI